MKMPLSVPPFPSLPPLLRRVFSNIQLNVAVVVGESPDDFSRCRLIDHYWKRRASGRAKRRRARGMWNRVYRKTEAKCKGAKPSALHGCAMIL